MKYLLICHCLGKVSGSAWLWAEGVDWWRKISWTSFHPHIRESSAQSCVSNTEKNVSCEKVELWRVLEHTELESWGWDHCDTYTWYTGEHWREETKTWARTTSVESWETLEKLVLTSVQMTRGLLWENNWSNKQHSLNTNQLVKLVCKTVDEGSCVLLIKPKVRSNSLEPGVLCAYWSLTPVSQQQQQQQQPAVLWWPVSNMSNNTQHHLIKVTNNSSFDVVMMLRSATCCDIWQNIETGQLQSSLIILILNSKRSSWSLIFLCF